MLIIGACNCLLTSKWAYSWGAGGGGGVNVEELITGSLQ